MSAVHACLAPTPEEIATMTAAEIADRKAAAERNVFGHDFKRDKNGRPIEQGIGGPMQPNDVNHLAALAKDKAGRALNEAILKSVKDGGDA
jgi:hypothetical protein